MATVETIVSTTADSVFEIGDRVVRLLKEAQQEAGSGAIPENISARLADSLEALRSRLIQKSERDPRSLFDLDDRLIALMNAAEEAAEDGGISQELLQEINDYLEAFRTKVDRIAGYCRWQESIAAICGAEAERLSARKRAAERRVNRLKDMLLAFMIPRSLKRIEGQKAAISLQANSAPSLVVDNPLQIGDSFLEKSLRFTKTELQEIVYQIADGTLRCRLEAALAGNGWEINNSAVRAAITNSCPISGARLVKGHHVRIR